MSEPRVAVVGAGFGGLAAALRLQTAHRPGARFAPTRGLPHWEKPAETIAALDAFWSDHAPA